MKKLVFTLIALFATFAAFSQAEADTSKFAQFNSRFAYKTFTHESITLPYRQTDIHAEASCKSALVIYLHGSSAKGNDNISQLKTSAIRSIIKYLENSNTKATIVVPQCSKGHSWNESDSKTSTAVKKLIDELLAANPSLDSKKVYIFGSSTGGAGVWRMISDYPGTFAAAMIVAAYPWNVYPAYLAKTPLCCVVGTKDKNASKSKVMPTIKEMQKREGKVNFVELKGLDHPSTCRDAYTDENIKWVFNN